MKKLIFTFTILFAVFVSKAQNSFWHENFDAPSFGDSVTPYSFNNTHQWDTCSRLFVSPAFSDSAYLGHGDTLYLSMPVMDFATPGFSFVTLEFDHICKVHFLDICKLEFSYDGFTWTEFQDDVGGQNVLYLGTGNYSPQLSNFSTASYSDWFPGLNDTIPLNTWWKHEKFDISMSAGNIPTFYMRFKMYDFFNDLTDTLNGWAIDNIDVQAAPCELNPPEVVQLPPIYQNIAYSLGPYILNVADTDQSGILNSYLIYTINGGIPDTIDMDAISTYNYTDTIPPVNPGDTVCYWFSVIDGSGCLNTTTTVQKCFVALAGIAFDYCDGFDGSALWTDTTITGSAWQLGTPAFGATTGALSPPNAWDVDLTAGYQNGTETYLYSPVFDFPGGLPSTANARITFWQNRNILAGDGFRLQYTADGGVTWNNLGTIGCVTCANWYTDNFLCDGTQTGWSGNSGGWIKSDYIYNGTEPGSTTYQLRFVFCSDFNGTLDGVSIDDFCFMLPHPNDPGISTIISPINNAPDSTCVPVTVAIHNYGSTNLDSSNVFYSYNGITYGPFLWTGSLAPGAETNFTMPCVLVDSGNITLCAWVVLGTDVNHLNDTACANVLGIPTITIIQGFPYCDNFDLPTSIWFSQLMPGGNPGSNWELGTPAFGTTNTPHTTPNSWDINLNSAYTNDANVALYSPFFDIQNASNPFMNFWVNFNTEQNWDGVRLEYLTPNSGGWQLLNPAIGTVNWYNMPNIFCSNLPAWAGNSAFVLQNPTGTGWAKVEANDLTVLGAGLPGQTVQFRFVFCSDPSVIVDGFSIDDFCFAMPPPLDAGVTTITPSGNAPAGNCIPVDVIIKNFGTDTLTSFNVYYTMGPNTNGPYLWTGTLPPGQTTSFSMPCDTVQLGLQSICSWTDLGGDGNHFNDTTCVTIFGVGTIVIDSLAPYCDDFDSGISLWFSQLNVGGSTGTIWELGTPSFGTTNSPHSAPNAWDINLTTAYTNSADVSLYTPYFDVSNVINPYLSFWLNWNTELNWDGVRMEYDTNASNNWQVLYQNLTDTVNWYNMNPIFCSNLPAWAGTTNGWIHSQANGINIPLGIGTTQFVQFRFIFCSDPSVIVDGFSIDDFCFAMPAPFDAGVTQIIQPGFSAPADSCSPVEVTIKNFGFNPLTSANVYYSKDDLPFGNPVTYGPFLWTGNLAPGTSTTWVLPVCDTVPAGQYNFCSWTQLLTPTVDGNAFNDTSCASSIGVPTIPIGYSNSYCDDFENGNRGWAVQTTGGSGTNWELGTPAFGQTNTAYSPDTCWDINLTSPPQANALTYLYSPYFDFTPTAITTELSCFVNFNTGIQQDGVHLEYKIGGNAWATLFSAGQSSNWYNSVACIQAGWSGNSGAVLTGANINGWAPVIDTLPVNFNGAGKVQFRFVYCSNTFVGFPNDGFSIDNFCLNVPVPLTVAPTTCVNTSNPPFVFPGQSIQFSSVIKNKGTTPVSSAVACLYIDTVQIACDSLTFSPALTYNQGVNHTFSNSYITQPGVHNYCIITTLPNGSTDLNPFDDTLCCTLSVIDTVSVAGSPYCPDFDSSPQWVTLNAFAPYAPTSSWTFGPPNAGFMNSAFTGINAWKTGPLNGNYPNNDSSALFTPAFNIQVGRTYRFSFHHEYDFELYQDGGNVEYSTDFGGTWQVMGTGGLTTWYDSWFVTALGGSPPMPGWSLISQVWTNPHFEICFNPQNGQLAYPVMFRFRFASDYSVNHLGWLIDDFCFEDLGPCPLGIDEISSATGLILGQNQPNPTNGTTSISYVIPDNGNVVLEIINMLGQTVDVPVDQEETKGLHTVSFNTAKLDAGVYYYSLTFNNETLVKKMVITK